MGNKVVAAAAVGAQEDSIMTVSIVGIRRLPWLEHVLISKTLIPSLNPKFRRMAVENRELI
jgi:hypothetical protein